MSVETMLPYATGIISALLALLTGLLAYVFVSLRTEVLGVKTDIGELSRNRAKLVHKDECRESVRRVHKRLDEQEATLHQLNERVVRVEAILDRTEHP